MAKQKNRGESPPKQVPENDLNKEILLILDHVQKLVQAISKVDPKGKYQTVPADEEHNNQFLHIDKNASWLESFLKNFWSQLKDPSRFRLFTLKHKALDDPQVRQALRDLADGKQTAAAKAFLKEYEIVPKEDKSIYQKIKDTMAKKNQVPAPAQAEGAADATQPRYRFNESMINWEQLAACGLSRDFLQEKGLLDPLLRGYKTTQLIPISMNFGVVSLRADARLSFQPGQGGPVMLVLHTVRQKPELERAFFGHIFTEEDKRNLRETGNMGRVVELRTNSGDYVPSFISLDKLTNELVVMRAENVTIPDEISGVKLSEDEKNELREGRSVYLEGMVGKSGKEFDATVQINADRRGIEYIFNNDRLFNNQKLGGVELTQKQVEDLNAGRAIFVEDMTRTDGEMFSSFVHLDEASGRPVYTRYNPDSPEDARELYIPKEISGVKLTAEDRQQLSEGKAIFLENMVNRRGEEFSSFVKLDMKTGIPNYSRTPDGFTERAEVKIPTELWGAKLTAAQRAGLQSGKAVLVEGMTGYDGKPFSQYVKVNQNRGRLDFYNDNPDRRRNASQRNVVGAAATPKQEAKPGPKKETKPEPKRNIPRKPSRKQGPSVG